MMLHMSTIRIATYPDIPAMQALIALSGIELSAGFYTPEQAEAITREVFGVDTQLVDDETYFVVEEDGRMVACGGWSKRVTPFGGDQHKRGVDRLLDPATEAARIRAFFVHPSMARRGIGRRLLEHCAVAARAAGFSQLELTATMPGVPLYEACGFVKQEPVSLNLGGIAVPLVRMTRAA